MASHTTPRATNQRVLQRSCVGLLRRGAGRGHGLRARFGVLRLGEGSGCPQQRTELLEAHPARLAAIAAPRERRPLIQQPRRRRVRLHRFGERDAFAASTVSDLDADMRGVGRPVRLEEAERGEQRHERRVVAREEDQPRRLPLRSEGVSARGPPSAAAVASGGAAWAGRKAAAEPHAHAVAGTRERP